MEKGLNKRQVIQELTRSPHGKLEEYLPIVKQATEGDFLFMSHLIAWNEENGQVRDAKVALPIITLHAYQSASICSTELLENSLAHIAKLDPRNLLRALKFAKQIKTPGMQMKLRRLVEAYIRFRESNWAFWEKTAVQHRKSLKDLYRSYYIKPNALAQMILFEDKYPEGTVFEKIKNLSKMGPSEALATVTEHRIPFLVAKGALGKNLNTDSILALIKSMSPTELITNMKMLEKLGVQKTPALRAALEEKLEQAKTSKKQVLKTTVAADQLDGSLKEKLQGLQERQLTNIGPDGDWLVLSDKSGSMQEAIEVSRHVAATLAKVVKGKVHLVFFDTSAYGTDVTGKSYEDILKLSRNVVANGGTSIGIGLDAAIDRGLNVDGIAIVSDAQENTPPLFAKMYEKFVAKEGKEPPVYLFRMGTMSPYFSAVNAHFSDQDLATSCKRAGIDLQTFELKGKVDYSSIPNLVQMMRASKFSLVDQIMESKLLSLRDVLKDKAEGVMGHV